MNFRSIFVYCYLIKVPDPEACPPLSYYSPFTKLEKEEFNPKKLFPLLEVAEFSHSNSFAMVGTHLYSMGGPIEVCHEQTYPNLEDVFQPMTSFCKNTIGIRDVWILDLTRPWDNWKAGPQMKFFIIGILTHWS